MGGGDDGPPDEEIRWLSGGAETDDGAESAEDGTGPDVDARKKEDGTGPDVDARRKEDGTDPDGDARRKRIRIRPREGKDAD
jgi:hypothetical protein